CSRPQPAPDLEQEAAEADVRDPPRLGERPAAGPLEPAVPARDRERHLRVLRADVELAEEPGQIRVVRLVVDDEAGVEAEAAVLDRVDVAARTRVGLEDLHVVCAGEQVRGTEAGDARSDDRNPHGGYSNRPEDRLSRLAAR